MKNDSGTRDFLVEVCAADLQSVLAAFEGGAHRIELCENLAEGGTTPSLGKVQMALQVAEIPVRVLIRPRGGDFTYAPIELEEMVRDIEAMRELGVQGFVLGALTPGAEVDARVMEVLLSATGGLPWTFHRAYDFCADPYGTLETIIHLGADTLLTSGQAATALQGAPVISLLNQTAAGRIAIMAGGGISPDNVTQVRELTGCRMFHLSGRSAIPNHLITTTGAVLNAPGLHPCAIRKTTDPAIIRATIANLSL